MSDIEDLVAELTGTAGWLKRTNELIDAGRVQRAITALEQTVKERDEARAEVIDQGIRLQQWEESAEKMNAHCDIIEERVRDAEAERDALADRIERARELVERDVQIEAHNERVPIHRIGELQRRPTSSEYRRILSEGESS